MIKTKLLFLSLIFSLFAACAPKPFVHSRKSALAQLRSKISYLIKDPNLGNAYLGIYIAAIDQSEVVFRLNEHKLLIPASNMKLYTTAVSLQKLGPNFRFKTRIFAEGMVQDSVLKGDLIIKGSGDPTISGRAHNGDILFDFRSWADSLHAKGINKIDGRLVGDNSFFANDRLASGWEWDDEPYWYAAQTSALAFNDNCVDLIVKPNSLPGQPVLISQNPVTSYVQILNQAVTSEGDSLNTLDFGRERARNVILITGLLPMGANVQRESITVEKPADYFITVLAQVLKDNGIRISGNTLVIRKKNKSLYKGSRLLFTHLSPKLSAIVRVVNKLSHNFYAEQLLKNLGGLYNGEGSFKSGTRVVTTYLNSIGIPDREFIMQDGSGLSRKNFISPLATATLLRKMALSSNFIYYFNSLPIAGVDGTLEKRMLGMRAAGNVHAKTGYVGNVRNLSGYIHDRKNRRYVFSILVNNYSVTTSYINDLQDKICNLISEYDGEL